MVTVRVLNLGALAKFVTKEDMQAAAEYMLKLQAERVAQGIGQRGKPMKRLSKDYAEEEGKGRVRTLKRTGKMLDSRGVLDATEKRATIGFQNAEKYYYVNQARSPFVKATKEERQKLAEFLAARVKKRLRENLASARATKS